MIWEIGLGDGIEVFRWVIVVLLILGFIFCIVVLSIFSKFGEIYGFIFHLDMNIRYEGCKLVKQLVDGYRYGRSIWSRQHRRLRFICEGQALK